MKKLISILSIFLIIALIIISISLFFQNKGLKNEIHSLNTRISELINQNQETEELISKGWTEYTDNKYNFKIWYPEVFNNEIYDSSHVEIGGDDYNNIHWIYLYLSDIKDAGSPVRITNIFVEKNNLDIKDYIKEDIEKDDAGDKISPLQDQYITKEKINGIDLYKAEIPKVILRYYTKKDSLVFTFNPVATGIDYPQKENKEVFEQVVKSFRFTE